MATINVPYDRSNLRSPMLGEHTALQTRPLAWLRVAWGKLSPAATVLGMFGYLLLLGSLAVVVVTDQFPWFTLAPVTILLLAAYFRYVDEKEARRSARD